MENNKNKKSVKFQGDMLNFYDFIQVFIFATNHHLKPKPTNQPNVVVAHSSPAASVLSSESFD